MKAKDFVQRLDLEKIKEAISSVERRSSGEIRVVVTTKNVDNPLTEAAKEFTKLKMHETRDRNGVLILFAPKSQKFAVWGDIAVYEKCGQDFWRGIVENMIPLLKAGRFTEAIVSSVEKIGNVLIECFPRKPDDENEKPDDVVLR